jgi:hypothetical protein
MPETTASEWLPAETREQLRTILEHGNSAFTEAILDERGEDIVTLTIIAGTRANPGLIIEVVTETSKPPVLGAVFAGLVAGERHQINLTRTGRHFVRTGELAQDEDISTTDVDLAAWGRGQIEYLTSELLEAVDAILHRVATTRAEALAEIIDAGVISADEARTDVTEDAGTITTEESNNATR